MAAEHEHHPKFKLIVDQNPFTWPEPTITGAQIKALAGVDPSYGVWQEIPGGKTDPEISDNQSVDLSKPGTEKVLHCQEANY